MDVNAALPSRAALLRQSGVLRQIRSEQNLPHAYRNSPSYGTLPPSRRAVRSNCMKRILIIEDDRDIVELVRYNLANEGFQVSAAHDGSTGLSTLKKTPPDLLLLDLMLPKLSGLEICRDRKSTRLNSSHSQISYAVFCLKKKKKNYNIPTPVNNDSKAAAI